ncbi:YcjF family protein [Pseudoruegeria sp. SHC-113]|uniref:YcjF family protein n=1 Tax=Pseudoruegeria sp. SHC-113 TaxID=2855439 RepID=UPI0021BB4714|nr:YcjF family protein [Pseudoruegeria sp. SHC-113]MCT8159665.1 YcjF family protein [Pseudoruegeria sp. SHC-113]
MSEPRQPARPGPVLIDIEEGAEAHSPAEAPPVPDAMPVTGAAMQQIAQIAARPRSRLSRWFWGLLGALFTFVLSVAAWDFVAGLLARNALLGNAALALVALFIMVLLAIAGREWLAFARLRRIDHLQHASADALLHGNLGAARKVSAEVKALYAGRKDLDWAMARFNDREADQLDAEALLGLVETELLAPIDAAATREVEAAARQVATVTAIVPIALADVVAALTANVRMVRRIAELYGGRAGTLGSWRLMRTVITHLVATGAVAVGDDLIGSVAGGGMVSKISRRFGEGIVNGALTARVGVAALEVCRPLAFSARKRPSVTGIVQRALRGLFGQG